MGLHVFSGSLSASYKENDGLQMLRPIEHADSSQRDTNFFQILADMKCFFLQKSRNIKTALMTKINIELIVFALTSCEDFYHTRKKELT